MNSDSVVRAKLTLLMFAPAVAWAMEQKMAEAAGVSWWMIGGILLFSALGWAIADLDQAAELWNPANGTVYERMKASLTLVKGVLASMGAGAGTFALGKVAPMLLLPALGLQRADGQVPVIPEMLLLFLAAGAAYGGSRWWTAFERKATPGG